MKSKINSQSHIMCLLTKKPSLTILFEIVVAYPDRLVRFGYDFVEWFCNLFECRVIALNTPQLSPQQEMMQDFMSIMHCFSAKLYFLRKYEKKYGRRLRMRILVYSGQSRVLHIDGTQAKERLLAPQQNSKMLYRAC